MVDARREEFYDFELKKLIKLLHLAHIEKDVNLEKKFLLKLARLNYDFEFYFKARLNLEKILAFGGEIKGVYYFLGLIDLELGAIEDAHLNFKREIKVNPEHKLAKKVIRKLEIHSNFPVVTLLLFFINSLLFFYFSYPKIDLINSILYGLNYSDFNFFNLITSLFFHINLLHYVINMVMLLSFGFVLEKEIDSLKFALVYFLSGMIGMFFEVFLVSDIIVMGASASIFGVLGALMLFEPFLKIRVLGIFRAPIILVLGGIFMVSIFVSAFVEIGLSQGNISHLIGFLVGVFIMALFNREKIGVFYNWIFIFIGFWLVKLGVDSVFLDEFDLFGLFIVFGSCLIWYSYMILKKNYSILN